MRRIPGILSLLVSALSGFEYPLEHKQVTPDVHCFIGFAEAMNTTNNGNIVNSCYIDAGESYVVIDTGPSYAYAESVYNAMQKIKPQPVALVINTHIHDDHWLGNSFFTQKGVVVLGSDDFARSVNLREPPRMQALISPEAYRGTVPTLPAEMISEETVRTVGNQELVIKMVKRKAHTDKDLYVYLPRSGVLFAADLVFNDRLPSVRGGNVNGWIQALDAMDALKAKHVIGGHGGHSDADAARMTRAYLTQLRDEVRAAIDDGLSIDEAMDKVTMDAFRRVGMYGAMHRGNVEATYRVLEWE